MVSLGFPDPRPMQIFIHLLTSAFRNFLGIINCQAQPQLQLQLMLSSALFLFDPATRPQEKLNTV